MINTIMTREEFDKYNQSSVVCEPQSGNYNVYLAPYESYEQYLSSEIINGVIHVK